jgi:hypothetical protein
MVDNDCAVCAVREKSLCGPLTAIREPVILRRKLLPAGHLAFFGASWTRSNHTGEPCAAPRIVSGKIASEELKA